MMPDHGARDQVGFESDDRLDVEIGSAGELLWQFATLLRDRFVDPRQISGVVAAPCVLFDADRDCA